MNQSGIRNYTHYIELEYSMKRFLSSQSSTVRLIIGILLSIAFSGVFFIAGLLLGTFIFETDLNSFMRFASSGSNADIIRYFLLVQSFSVFIVPSLCICYSLSQTACSFFDTQKQRTASIYLISSITIILALPFINFLAEFNKLLIDVILGAENWMADSEESAKLLTESILNTSNLGTLMANLFVMAVLPALGEELFFRGTIQKLFLKRIANEHIAILLTAVLFSALHIQFYGFIPRMVMGLFLGYLYVWLKNIWVPILVHFANNATAVILYYLIYNEYLPETVETIGGDTSTIGTSLLSFVAVMFLIWLLSKEARLTIFSQFRQLKD